MFNLPSLRGTLPAREKHDIIYFSCDYEYFYRHGYALAASINRTLSWMHVHCHIINEDNINHKILGEIQRYNSFTYTWEDIPKDFYSNLPKNIKRMKDGIDIFKTKDIDYIARRTYLASARFMRIPEIFKGDFQYVLQVDCDSVLKNGFHKNDFEELTRHVGVMPKPKDPNVFIASAITLGIKQDGLDFRKLFAQRMIEGFENGCYWFIDQDVLRSVITEWVRDKGKEFNKIPYKWNSWGLKRDDVFSTGKGGKKNDRRYKAAQLPWLPEPLRTETMKELRNLNVKK